ncbi:MAG TPA: 1-(5-phosphoribosyl)-5-[(5-phosphoribosylamino)methylideneamino]imidazole-4-carboxamide isomerase [Acidimicrobiales bacterium]|nr:1-(5-phosphoribosyl)-5-[(5-phosphoribosylamino)methylideneamino]imidazole-4-carboxamide isomerase [Acidimicrobiales bacterium]
MDLYPAIDLRAGRCVRLVEGDFSQETVYGDDPVAVANRFAGAGARWIHVVDLDAALTGDAINRPVVAAIAASVARSGVAVQTGGGVRTVADAAALLDHGVARVVIGTAAVERPDLVSEVSGRWPGQVAVGLDHRGGEVRLRGWTEGSGRSVNDLVPEVMAAGAAAVIVTDISRDGRLAGPDIDGLRELVDATGAPVIASGGVSSLDDITALAAVAGLSGVIVGKAIYEGRVDVVAAVKALA